MTWQTINRFREQYDPMPSRGAVMNWIRAGRLEMDQPGGPGGTIWVRRVNSSSPESEEDQIRSALRAASQT